MGLFHVAINLRGQVRGTMLAERFCDFTGPGFANVFLLD